MNIDEANEFIKDRLKIDSINLDDESIRTPQLYGEVLTVYNQQLYNVRKKEIIVKKILHERSLWLMGKQTDAYYKKHGVAHHKILKSELSTYLDADPLLAKEVLELQEMKVVSQTLELGLRAVKDRSFSIKDAISWRIFQSGG